MTKNDKKVEKELYELVKEWLKGSIKKQDSLFNSSWKNKLLFKKAKKLATF
jgi:hemerythrin